MRQNRRKLYDIGDGGVICIGIEKGRLAFIAAYSIKEKENMCEKQGEGLFLETNFPPKAKRSAPPDR